MSLEVDSPGSYSAVMDELLNMQTYEKEFCLVHERDILNDGKDIDLVVGDPSSFKNTIKQLGYYPLTEHHWIKYIVDGKVWVILDVSDKYSFFSNYMEHLNYTAIINSAIPTNIDPNIKKLSEWDLAVYTLFKGALVRGCYPAKYVQIIKAGMPKGSDGTSTERYKFLPKPMSNYYEDFDSARNNDDTISEFILRTQSEFGKTPHKRSLCARLLGRARKVLSKNRAIAVVGPDGSGKTSIVQELGKLPLVHVKYMGPGQGDNEILPIFRVPRDMCDRLRRRWAKGTIHGNAVRLGYLLVVYCDLVFRFYSQKWRWDSGDIVVFDRFAFDVYIRNPDVIRKALFVHLFPTPKTIVLLEGDPEEIHQRKPELSGTEIMDTYRRYREIIKQKRMQCVTIRTTDHSIAQSLMAVIEGLSVLNVIPVSRE